jgi:hypothetical protein
MKEAIKIKIMILLSILTAMLLGCSPNKEELREQEAIKAELAQTHKEYDSIEKSMMTSLDEIDKRIGLIKSQKGYLVFSKSGSDVRNKKEEILNNIAVMDELLADNENRIEKLRSELKRIGSTNKGLKKRILKYEEENKMIADELTGLRQDLIAVREENDKLTVENEKLNIEASNQAVMYDNLQTQYTKAEQDAYVAYVKTGSRKDLKKENIIEKKNLRTLIAPDEINADVKPDNFEKIDTRTALQIPLETKEAKIVTTHDASSYKWCDDTDGKKRLCIVDPQMFWEKSKYLVIETK